MALCSKNSLFFDSWNLCLEKQNVQADIQRIQVNTMTELMEEADTLKWLFKLQNSYSGLRLPRSQRWFHSLAEQIDGEDVAGSQG